MNRWRASSRERINRCKFCFKIKTIHIKLFSGEGQGVDVFIPLPPKNSLERVRQEKVGQKYVFGVSPVNCVYFLNFILQGTAVGHYGNLREDLQSHIRTKTPEPVITSKQSSLREENMSDKIRKEYKKYRRSRSIEPVTRASNSRGRTPLFSSSAAAYREPETRHSSRFDRDWTDGIHSRGQSHERSPPVSRGRNSFYSSAQEPSIEPPTKRSRKTPRRRSTSRDRTTVFQSKYPYSPRKSILNKFRSLTPPEERRPTLEQQIIQQPSVALAIWKLYGPKLQQGFPYVPNFLTPEVRNNGEGLPAINYIMNEIFLKSDNLQD